MCSTRSARSATCASCVTTIKVVFDSRCKSCNKSNRRSPFFESNDPVGSSASKTRGELASARATRHALTFATRQYGRQRMRAITQPHLIE